MCVCLCVCLCVFFKWESGSRWEIMANFELEVLGWKTVDRQRF